MNLTDYPGVFIAGTDTGIGKTWISALILEELLESGVKAVGLKPVCSGDRGDAERLHEAGGKVLDVDTINPRWFKTPVAPLTAGRIEGEPLVLADMVAQVNEVRSFSDFILVEGAGGWEVPLGEGFGIPDFAKELGLPVIVVAANWLGAINHTLLTVKAIQASGLTCLGVILNHLQAERDVAVTTNRMILEELCPVPILGEVITDGTWIDWSE